jgi:hypothetical protein
LSKKLGGIIHGPQQPSESGLCQELAWIQSCLGRVPGACIWSLGVLTRLRDQGRTICAGVARRADCPLCLGESVWNSAAVRFV